MVYNSPDGVTAVNGSSLRCKFTCVALHRGRLVLRRVTALRWTLRPYSICRFRFAVNPDLDSLANRMVWIHDSSALSEVTSLLFVYVCDTDVTFGFASESTSKLDSLDSRIRIRFRQIEYGLRPGRRRAQLDCRLHKQWSFY